MDFIFLFMYFVNSKKIVPPPLACYFVGAYFSHMDFGIQESSNWTKVAMFEKNFLATCQDFKLNIICPSTECFSY